MNTNLPIVTRRDALRLLDASEQTSPSPERIELTRWLMQMCREHGWGFSEWNEPLYPALDSFGDVELIDAIEETFGTEIDEVEIRATAPETFGELIAFLEPRLAATPVFQRLVNESWKMSRAVCPTQAAFYVVRRRLCEAGAAYNAVRKARPSMRLRRLTDAQAKYLVTGLHAEYGIGIPLTEVLWGWMEAEAAVLAMILVSSLVCVFLPLFLPGYPNYMLLKIVGSFVLWAFTNLFLGGLIATFSHPRWPRKYRTLGDLARKIAELTPAPQGAL